MSYGGWPEHLRLARVLDTTPEPCVCGECAACLLDRLIAAAVGEVAAE